IKDSSDFRRIFERKLQERQQFVEEFYGQIPGYDVAIDFSRKAGPIAKIGLNVGHEEMRLENGGPGPPGRRVLRPRGELPPGSELPPPRRPLPLEEPAPGPAVVPPPRPPSRSPTPAPEPPPPTPPMPEGASSSSEPAPAPPTAIAPDLSEPPGSSLTAPSP